MRKRQTARNYLLSHTSQVAFVCLDIARRWLTAWSWTVVPPGGLMYSTSTRRAPRVVSVFQAPFRPKIVRKG